MNYNHHFQKQCCDRKQLWKLIQYYVRLKLNLIAWPIVQLPWMNKKYNQFENLSNSKKMIFLIIFSISSDRMVHKRGMCRNAAQMAGINQFSAIVLLAIVGVFMKILAKIYRAHRSKMADRIVQ